jgi:MFS transporter, DHA2 family, multidrug resistance protein
MSAPSVTPQLMPGQTLPLLIGLGLATGMEFYTFDSMNLVLPDLTGTLGVSRDEGSWLLTVYSTSLFLGVPLTGWMAGHFGFKRFVIGSVALFTAASLSCSISPTLETMLIGRAVQGLAGAGLLTCWRASIYLLMEKKQRSQSMLTVSTMLYMLSATGLLISGYVTDQFTWRLIFLPVLPFATGAIWLVSRYFPETPPPTADRLVEADWLGIALLCVAAISLQILLSRGVIDDWLSTLYLRLLSIFGLIALIFFVAWQSSGLNRAPLLWFGLLRDRRVLSSALIGVFTGMILSGSLYVLPFFLRIVDTQTHSATQTGRIIAIYALTALVIRPFVVPRLIAGVGQRKAITTALIMLIASMLLFYREMTSDTPDRNYFLPLVLYAFGLAPLLSAVGSGTVARVEHHKLLDGVTLYMTFRQLGASLGVGFLSIFLEWRETLHSANLYTVVQRGHQATGDFLGSTAAILSSGGGRSVSVAQHAALAYLADVGRHQVETLSYADAFLLMATVGVATLCLVPVIPPTPVARK